MSWLLALVGFALLIVLHELGHFAAAKAVGMRVEKFSLFFGKPFVKYTRGETQYGIGWLPLGGYVKITGMSPDEARELPPELYARSYAGSTVGKRIFVIAAGPVVNIVIAFVLLTGLLWSHGRYVPGISVASPVEATYNAAKVLRPGDRIVSITAPASGAAASKTAVGDTGSLTSTKDETDRIAKLVDIVSTGGCGAKPLGTKDSTGNPQFAPCATPVALQVAIQRDGRSLTVPVTPKYDEQRKRYRLGIGFDEPLQAIGPVTASGESVKQMWFVTKASVSAIAKIVYDPQARKEVSGVVGSYEATRQSFEISLVRALSVLALISLSLAIINLFPFLPLDGGHIFWAIVEKLRGGKPVSTAVLERATIVGLILVVALAAVGLNNDLTRIFNGSGFGVR